MSGCASQDNAGQWQTKADGEGRVLQGCDVGLLGWTATRPGLETRLAIEA